MVVVVEGESIVAGVVRVIEEDSVETDVKTLVVIVVVVVEDISDTVNVSVRIVVNVDVDVKRVNVVKITLSVSGKPHKTRKRLVQLDVPPKA